MLAVRLDPELDSRLSAAARLAGRTKSAFARAAIERFIEDMEDIAAAEAALRNYDPDKTISLEQLRQELGLDN
ncbi:MAG: CopG family transcriptional regulator [Erythrobacter sp. RIFCSPHIGHO2_12_FULL_63_10]|nr:MAG: CopG family transcriptional regulator [Erythrobacter sp. RIFCSPHIGHO2_12_FULL_63_10]